MNKGVVYALWGYEAQNSDELTFHEGDAITILRRKDESETEWWWARLGDREGYVPKNLLGVGPLSAPHDPLSCASFAPEVRYQPAVRERWASCEDRPCWGPRAGACLCPRPSIPREWAHVEGTGPASHGNSRASAQRFLMGNCSEHPVSPRADHRGLEKFDGKFSACRLPHVVCDCISPGVRWPPPSAMCLSGAGRRCCRPQACRAHSGARGLADRDEYAGGPQRSRGWSRGAGVREHWGGVSADCRAGHAAIWDGQGRGAWRLAPRSRSACHALTRVCCAPAVPADQTPAADARLSPLERCTGLGRGAAVRTLRFRSGDGCRGAPLSRRRLLGEALSPLPPPRRRNFASYCKSK